MITAHVKPHQRMSYMLKHGWVYSLERGVFSKTWIDERNCIDWMDVFKDEIEDMHKQNFENIVNNTEFLRQKFYLTFYDNFYD